MTNIMNRKSTKLIIAVVGALLFVGLCWVYEAYVALGGNVSSVNDIFTEVQPLKIFAMIGLFILTFLLLLSNRTAEIVFKYRYVIAILLFFICVVIGIHGSSLGCFNRIFGIMNSDVKMGTTREIRSDEWATFTPMTFSQYYNPEGAFSYFNSIVRGESTDVFIEYGQPVASALILYKPFYIGYILFPIANGLAFFWCGRLIVLFLVSFEFARLITKDNRKLSLMFALALVFAPAVQWWFAINGFVEMLIDIQLAIIMFHKFMICKNSKKRVLYTAVIVWCAGSYILTMYPAWMISLAYVLLGLIIWIIIKDRKEFEFHKIDVLTIAVGLLVLALSMGYVFFKSSETIHVMMNTAYPGNRFETGGDLAEWMTNYIFPMWYSIGGRCPFLNPCEASFFIDFFPLNYILFFYLLTKKKTNSLLWILLVLSIFFGVWCVWGFPTFLAKVTFMSLVLRQRAIDVFCLVNLLMLFVETSIIREEKYKSIILTIISLIGVMLVAVESIHLYPNFLTTGQVVATFIVFALITIGFVLPFERLQKTWIWLFAALMFISGAFVNPVCVGVETTTNLQPLLSAQHVNEKDPGKLWAVMDDSYPWTEALLIKGIKTINSTNVYPDLDRWKLIDEDAKYEDVYNRYAHVNMYLVEDDYDGDKFELPFLDQIKINVKYEDLKSLDISYIFTRTDITDDSRYEFQGGAGPWQIYKVK